MKFLLLPIVTCSFFQLRAQYYYNDIVGTLETNRQMNTYLSNKVKMVSATGYDPAGVKATDYSEVQEIKENGRALKISSVVNFNHSLYYNRFDAQNRLISITDSGSTVQNVTTYEYDNAGRISRVQNTTTDTAN